MKITTTFTANATKFLGAINKPRALTGWTGTFFTYGSGYGTIAWQFSPDGTTANLLPLTDYAGTAITSTAADSFQSNFGNGSKLDDAPLLYATLTGGSTVAISITAGYFDNQG